MIKEVPNPTLECVVCVFYGKFQCIEKECRSLYNPIKYIEVTE